MKINFITTFLITYLIQIPYVYAADAAEPADPYSATPCWTYESISSCDKGQKVTYIFVATNTPDMGYETYTIVAGTKYSLSVCQTFPPNELPESFTEYIGKECSSFTPKETELPCYDSNGVYHVASDFKVTIFDADVFSPGSPTCVRTIVQDICILPEPPALLCYSSQQNGKECLFTVDPGDFVLKENCVLDKASADQNDPYLQFVRNGKIYSCATQLGEDAKFVQPFKYPIETQDGTIKNPGGQNSLDDCVLKQGSKDSPYEDDAGQYIFTSGTCSDLYCTDITADLCGGVS